MVPLSKNIQKLGYFEGEGGQVPIFGCEEITLSNATEWEINQIGLATSGLAKWVGDSLPKYEFRFELVAGIPEIETRKDLFNLVKLMLSWEQAKSDDGKIIPPPSVTLNLSPYIYSTGFIMTCTVNNKAPWEIGAHPYPSRAVFTGEFLIMPGFELDGKEVNIVELSKKLNSAEIASKLFVLQ